MLVSQYAGYPDRLCCPSAQNVPQTGFSSLALSSFACRMFSLESMPRAPLKGCARPMLELKGDIIPSRKAGEEKKALTRVEHGHDPGSDGAVNGGQVVGDPGDLGGGDEHVGGGVGGRLGLQLVCSDHDDVDACARQ